jgi:hydroxymethylpyrimidine kinase/phosphomethylpyrimidine kinase
MIPNTKPVCLSIAGLDPSGGAGMIADVKTFRAFGCHATAVVTSVTFQNTTGVFGAESQSSESVRRQMEAILDDLEVVAIKTGMLPTRKIIEVVAEIIQKRRFQNIVVDPVIRSTSGFELIDKHALQALTKTLFPVATLVMPNIPETEMITGIAIESDADIRDAAAIIREMGARNVLIKGGHSINAECRVLNAELGRRSAVDHLFIDGELQSFSSEYIDTTATHGTGCVLSSAIAANLALGKPLADAVAIAKEFVTNAIRTAPNIGHGHSPINV